MKLRKQKIDEIPQSSMSDVAFLLLVFFIFALIAYVIVRGFELRRQGASSAETPEG